jgi:Sulfite exporter TauE/SafE
VRVVKTAWTLPYPLQPSEKRSKRRRALDDETRFRREARWRLLRVDRNAHEVLEPGVGQSGEGVEIGRVVARVERHVRPRASEESAYRGSLVRLERWTNLEHLAAPAGNEPGGARALGYALERDPRLRLVLGLAVVVGEGQSLVLDLEADRVAERSDRRHELGGPRIELEPVVPDVAGPADADERLGFGTGTTAHERDEEIACRETLEFNPGLGRHPRELGPRDDGRERAVDVEDERAPVRYSAERRKRIGCHRRENTAVPRTLPWGPVFIGIGVAAGFFSALFGVGGGTIIVPLLILLAGFAAAEATATSLATIGLTAFFGMVAFGILGEVSWKYAVVVGLPAMAGTLVGTWLQRRVSSRLLVGLFSLLLLGIAIRLFLE